jgi:hypothetical protein
VERNEHNFFLYTFWRESPHSCLLTQFHRTTGWSGHSPRIAYDVSRQLTILKDRISSQRGELSGVICEVDHERLHSISRSRIEEFFSFFPLRSFQDRSHAPRISVVVHAGSTYFQRRAGRNQELSASTQSDKSRTDSRSHLRMWMQRRKIAKHRVSPAWSTSHGQGFYQSWAFVSAECGNVYCGCSTGSVWIQSRIDLSFFSSFAES